MSGPQRAAPAAWARQPAAPLRPRTSKIPEGFVVILLLCQVALLVPGIGALRLAVRMAAFGASLVLLALVRGRGRRHPAFALAVASLVVVAVEIFHPDTRSLVAGSAQAGLYVAVMAPLFWAPRLGLDVRTIGRLVLILWAFHTLSAAVGVLQVYFPGQFQPPLSAIVLSKGRGYVESLKIVTASGQRVFRPMGLTDIPGGASVSGLYATLFGTGFFLTRRRPLMMGASAVSMVLGLTALYLSQVRAVLVMTGIATLVVVAILAWRRDVARLGTLGLALSGAAVGGYVAALSLAGAAVTRRVATLTAARPGTVYYHERGHFFVDAFTNLLPQAPLGMGLGHWGMIGAYFGREGDAARPVWVEIQWAAWIVDGGVPLTLLYVAALLVALRTAWRIATAPAPGQARELPFWGAVTLAYGVGALALTFSYPIFLSQQGMEYWLLNGVLFSVAWHERRRAARALAPPAAPGVVAAGRPATERR